MFSLFPPSAIIALSIFCSHVNATQGIPGGYAGEMSETEVENSDIEGEIVGQQVETTEEDADALDSIDGGFLFDEDGEAEAAVALFDQVNQIYQEIIQHANEIQYFLPGAEMYQSGPPA